MSLRQFASVAFMVSLAVGAALCFYFAIAAQALNTSLPCAQSIYRWAKYNNRPVADAKQYCGNVTSQWLEVELYERFADGTWHKIASGPYTYGAKYQTIYAGVHGPTCRVGTPHLFDAVSTGNYTTKYTSLNGLTQYKNFWLNCG